MELRQLQESAGAIFDEDGIPVSFGNDEAAFNILDRGVALCDRSHWGLIKISGEDRLRYLHNQSTNDFEKLGPGRGCETVFVTSTARTIDLATAYVLDDEVWAIVSPNRCQQLLAWLDRFIFPFDKVELQDISSEYGIFSLIGARSDALLSELGIEGIIAQPSGNHDLVTIDNLPVRVAVGSGLATPGYTLIVSTEHQAKLWSKLTESGATPVGDRLWSPWRIQQGRPIPDKELTDDYNPLEAGLWHTISFEKGCYIGQETIARLNTYKGVKQRLWGVKLDRAVAPQTPITVAENKVGILTSYTDTPEGSFGLAYIRTKAGGEGLQVTVGEATGELVSVPFLSHPE